MPNTEAPFHANSAVGWETFPEQRRFEMFLHVQETELDDLNHVNNVVYLAWCEQVARQHALSLGLGTAALVELGAVPVAQRHLISYQRPAVRGDQVRVRTAITSSAGVRSTRLYTVDRLNPADLPQEMRLAECQTDWVWVQPTSGRPTRIPAAVLDAFGFSE